MTKLLHIGLAILLLIGLFDMPYGYYQLIRIVSFVIFIYLGITAYSDQRIVSVVVFAVGALLFNPIFKVALGRQIWNIVDILYAAFLIYANFKFKKRITNPK